MFGLGFFEIFVIAVVAVVFLGPDKLPSALVEIAKFWRGAKKAIEDAKISIDKELEATELKSTALNYKEEITNQISDLTKETKITEIANSLNDDISHIYDDEYTAKPLETEQDAKNKDEIKPLEFKKPLEVNSWDEKTK